MQDEMARLEDQIDQLLRQNRDYEAYIGDLEQKHADVIQQHTIETGDLRKKISVLTTHMQSLSVTGQSQAAAAAAAFNQQQLHAAEFSDLTAMDAPWDDTMQFADFVPVNQHPQVTEVKQEILVQRTETVTPSDTAEKPQQGGLLFMLFLVGAFVLSSRSTPSSIPRVSEDVRAASATLLDNVLKDAGVAHVSPSMAMASTSSSSWVSSSSAKPQINGLASEASTGPTGQSMLVDMAEALTQPTEQQVNEQLFSLSAAQYNGLTGYDDLGDLHQAHFEESSRSTSQGRRNLADALASIHGAAAGRDGRKESVADVYTRSLLWDQVPQDVVRTFAKMVAESRLQQQVDGPVVVGLD
jgi:hypothetical protein